MRLGKANGIVGKCGESWAGGRDERRDGCTYLSGLVGEIRDDGRDKWAHHVASRAGGGRMGMEAAKIMMKLRIKV